MSGAPMPTDDGTNRPKNSTIKKNKFIIIIIFSAVVAFAIIIQMKCSSFSHYLDVHSSGINSHRHI